MTEQEYWNNRYKAGGNSGYGSYDEQLEKKLNWLKTLQDVHSIVEVGCGDFNFGKRVVELFGASYQGFDVSDEIIRKNQLLYPQHLFQTMGPIPSADLVMCVDVLFHVLKNEDVQPLLDLLKSAWTKYLVVTAYERDETFTNHVRIRKFDYLQFGEPIIRETVEEDGNLKFYLFKK